MCSGGGVGEGGSTPTEAYTTVLSNYRYVHQLRCISMGHLTVYMYTKRGVQQFFVYNINTCWKPIQI